MGPWDANIRNITWIRSNVNELRLVNMPTMYDQNTCSSSSRWSFADAIALSFSSSSTCSVWNIIEMDIKEWLHEIFDSRKKYAECGLWNKYLTLVLRVAQYFQSNWIDRLMSLQSALVLANMQFSYAPLTVELGSFDSNHPSAMNLKPCHFFKIRSCFWFEICAEKVDLPFFWNSYIITAWIGDTDRFNFLLPTSISSSTRPINGRQKRVRFPLYASYDFVKQSNTFFNSSGSSMVSFLNEGQNCDDKISDDNGNISTVCDQGRKIILDFKNWKLLRWKCVQEIHHFPVFQWLFGCVNWSASSRWYLSA